MASGRKRTVPKKGDASSKKRKTSSKKATKGSKGGKQANYSEWFRSTANPRPGIIALNKGVPQGVLKPVEFSALNGMAIFEGDIAIGSVDEMRALVAGGRVDRDNIPVSGVPVGDLPAGDDSLAAAGVIIVGPEFRWPKGRVPYEIHPDLPDKNRVTKAIKHWEAKTTIRFIKRTPQNASDHPNYLSFEAHDGCWSFVGMRRGKQIVSLADGCGLGAAIHEIGHAVGLWHEQSREDRSKFIRIIWQNILPGREHNFNQHITDGDDVGKYDYGSIMHYPATAFSKNGQPTIIPLKPGGGSIGQRNGLSKGDIAAVKFMYP